MSSSPVQPGDVLAGKYRVERVLGAGGMGVVVAAWHMELEQLVAMKFLLPELASEGDAGVRFRREARAAVKIKSEHVARVLDVGVLENGVPFMVMEHLEGHDLSEELAKRLRLPILEAVDYLLQANEAIAEAHSVGIVHRDLKPANLFLAQRPGGVRSIKVLDFGISKLVIAGSSPSLGLTRTEALMGSPLYMSPEQLESSKDVDARADIWSLGVILHELVTGEPPFLGDTIPQLVRSVLAGKRRSIVELVGAPAGLEAVIVRCLASKREDRYQNVAQLSRALVPFGHEEAVLSAARADRVLGGSQPGHSDSASSIAASQRGGTHGKRGQIKSASYLGIEREPGARSRRGVAVGALALVGLVGAAGLYLASAPSRSTSETSSPGDTTDLTGAASPVTPPPTPLPTAPAPKPAVAEVPPVLPAAPTPTPSSVAPSAAPTAPAGASGSSARAHGAAGSNPVIAPRKSKPKPTTSSDSKPAPVHPPASPGALPDFGGRR